MSRKTGERDRVTAISIASTRNYIRDDDGSTANGDFRKVVGPDGRVIEELHFTVEQWTKDDLHVEEVMARVGNAIVAHAAFEAAVKVRPHALIYLRHRAHVMAKHLPEG